MQNAHQDYFANEILTASPAKLHLMLIEGAMRFIKQALHQLETHNNFDLATDAVVRALKIMSELLGALNPEHDSALVKRVAGEYIFIIRSLSEGNLRQDAEELRGALRVLDVQRGTWQRLNQLQQQQPPAAGNPSVIAPPHVARTTAAHANAPLTAARDDAHDNHGSFSLDA